MKAKKLLKTGMGQNTKTKTKPFHPPECREGNKPLKDFPERK